jgi:hypothetical protein
MIECGFGYIRVTAKKNSLHADLGDLSVFTSFVHINWLGDGGVFLNIDKIRFAKCFFLRRFISVGPVTS